MLSSLPSFLISVLLQVRVTLFMLQAHFGQSGNTAIKVFTCLYISIKISYVNTIMLAVIMSLNHIIQIKVLRLHEVKINRNIVRISLESH